VPALLKATATSLRAAKPGDRGFLRPRALAAFDVVVGPASVERVLTTLGALLDAASKEGIRFRSDRDSGQTLARVGGEEISLRLMEDSKRSKHVLSAKERTYDETDWYHRIPQWDYSPSGVLWFQVTDHAALGVRQRWGEGKRGPLHEKIPSLLEGLKRIAAAKIEGRRLSAIRAKQDAERARRRAVEQFREGERRQFREALIDQASGWHQASLIQAYIAEVASAADKLGQAQDAEFVHWHRWACATVAASNRLASPEAPWEKRVPEWDPLEPPSPDEEPGPASPQPPHSRVRDPVEAHRLGVLPYQHRIDVRAE